MVLGFFLDGVSWLVSLHILFGFLRLVGEECNTSITKSQRSRAGIPSSHRPASREIVSDSVELCETEVCFLHIQLLGTNVVDFQMRTKFTLKSILSLQDLRQCQSPESVPTCIDVRCFHMTILLTFTCVMNVRNLNESSVCHKLWSIL